MSNRWEPQWGVYYKRDTVPETYSCSYQQAIDEVKKYGSEVSLMILSCGEWTEVVYD